MKIQLKPFKVYVEKYHVEGGNIYPPRILNLKRVGIILLVIIGIVFMLSSCSSRRGYGCRGNYSWDQMIYKNTRP
jgi:hypothetical protein